MRDLHGHEVDASNQSRCLTDRLLPPHRPKTKDWLNGAERARFIEACGDSFYGAFYRLLVDTGLRPGEACALRCNDLDFARAKVRVERAVTRDGDGRAILADPKTVKSRRTVPMLAGLHDVLLRHLEWQREHGLDANIQQTANTYMHADPGVTTDWMERFERVMASEEQDASAARAIN